MFCNDCGVEAKQMSEERLPVGMRGGEFAELEYIAVVVLRAQKIAHDLPVGPWLKHTPVKQAIEHFLRAFEWQVKVVPSAVNEGWRSPDGQPRAF